MKLTNTQRIVITYVGTDYVCVQDDTAKKKFFLLNTKTNKIIIRGNNPLEIEKEIKYE